GRRTCSPPMRSTRSARLPSSSTARCACARGARSRRSAATGADSRTAVDRRFPDAQNPTLSVASWRKVMGSPLTPAFERLDEARRIAAEVRSRIGRKNDQAVAEALSVLEATLNRAAAEL